MTMWGLLLALFSYLYNTKKNRTPALIDIILCIILSVSTCLVCRIASGAYLRLTSPDQHYNMHDMHVHVYYNVNTNKSRK